MFIQDEEKKTIRKQCTIQKSINIKISKQYKTNQKKEGKKRERIRS